MQELHEDKDAGQLLATLTGLTVSRDVLGPDVVEVSCNGDQTNILYRAGMSEEKARESFAEDFLAALTAVHKPNDERVD
jgi:hypothetical protein